MKILLSIKPQFVKEIFNGNKKFEYRKAIFKNKDVKTIVVYATMPIGKIIGEFDIDTILEEHPSILWKQTKKYSGITEKLYYKYFSGRDKAFAIKIKSFKKYAKPLCPYVEYKNFVAPQFFKYLI